MKVPFSWLKELVDIDITAQELEDKLFSCGFEVEERIDLSAGIDKVVVGVITSIEKQEGTHLSRWRGWTAAPTAATSASPPARPTSLWGPHVPAPWTAPPCPAASASKSG